MEELREEVGVRESWIKWAGHMERMEGERLTKREDALRMDGRRGRPRLRWEEKFDESGRGVENESKGRMETVGGDGSETGLVMKKKREKKL